MAQLKRATRSKAKPKSSKEKSKLRAVLSRPGDKHKIRVNKHQPPPKPKKKSTPRKAEPNPKPVIIDLTSSSPPTKTNAATPQKSDITVLPPTERSPGLRSPITRSLSLSLSKPLVPPDLSKATQPPDYYIQPCHTPDITPGTVVWLPSKEDIVQKAFVDPKLHVNAFDHPAVVVSCPNPLDIYSVVEIAIMTTLGSRTLHETKKLSHRNLVFRVRTSQLPGAKVDITFKDARGMRGKYSFVNCHETWRVQIGTLGFYARGRMGQDGKGKYDKERKMDWLKLTAGSLEKLRASIGAHKGLWG